MPGGTNVAEDVGGAVRMEVFGEGLKGWDRGRDREMGGDLWRGSRKVSAAET